MENSYHFDSSAIELGKKILTNLEKNDDPEILTSWMSHYVAELITRAENEKGKSCEQEIQQKCVETILKLWAHRNVLPKGSRPFEGLEKAALTLARLAPENNQNFYFRQHLPDKVDNDDNYDNAVDAEVWLEFAEVFDKTAKEFIRLCIGQSLGTSATEMRNWLQMAYALEDEPAVDIQMVNSLIESESDQYIHDTKIIDESKSARVVAQLDKIIENFIDIRSAVILLKNSTKNT